MISTRSLLTIAITEEHHPFVNEAFLMYLFCAPSKRYNDGKQQFTKNKHYNQLDGMSQSASGTITNDYHTALTRYVTQKL
jgi:hypothetical protein